MYFHNLYLLVTKFEISNKKRSMMIQQDLLCNNAKLTTQKRSRMLR